MPKRSPSASESLTGRSCSPPSVIIIEVALLAAIMLHGQNNPTLARDAMFATLMIVLNGMVGTALLMGALRYWEQEYNLAGARAFLVVIASLAVFALIIPNYTKTEPDLRRL